MNVKLMFVKLIKNALQIIKTISAILTYDQVIVRTATHST